MSEFNIGDKVLCIDASFDGNGNKLKLNDIYTISGFYGGKTGFILRETGSLTGFVSTRFILDDSASIITNTKRLIHFKRL